MWKARPSLWKRTNTLPMTKVLQARAWDPQDGRATPMETVGTTNTWRIRATLLKETRYRTMYGGLGTPSAWRGLRKR
eukprot:7513147-Pyramimonas_sp.AAC.1